MVTVVKRAPEIVALFEEIRGSEWPARERFAIEPADALVWRSAASVNYLYADAWGRLGTRQPTDDTRAMCRNLRPKAAGFWGMEANFVSFLARNRCNPPVTRAQFRAWARALGVPIAAYDDRDWPSRIPDAATQLIFGGSPRPTAG